jgi:membrane-associated phospholipid phosphatase
MHRKLIHSWGIWLGVLLASVVGVVCIPWDLEISQSVQSIKIPGDLRKAVNLSEAFGHTIGPVAIFFTLIWIDIRNRKKLFKAALFTAICGISANAAKYVIPRLRPHSLDMAETEIASSWDTWGTPWTGSWFDEHLRSFPSGHSATAVAFAIGLYQVYPRGKWIFMTIAGLACFQRLVSSAHFLSDIMGGTVLSLLISLWFWRGDNSKNEQPECITGEPVASNASTSPQRKSAATE